MGKSVSEIAAKYGMELGYGSGDFLTGETVIEGGRISQSINGDGQVSLSWRSTSGGVIPIGTTLKTALGDYIMKETYVPSVNGDGTYAWSPTFTTVDSLLGKIPFYIEVETDGGEKLTLYTIPYTGPASTLIAALGNVLRENGYQLEVGRYTDRTISLSIDGDDVKSLCGKIASQVGATSYSTGCGLYIGESKAWSPDEYYNRFVVLGGTRNMGKKTVKGSYAQVTQRLTIDSAGSVIDLSGGEPKMTKILVNDDIYPKMELVVASVAKRLCWMLDEQGNRIADGDGGWKHYAKYYVTLATESTDGNGVITRTPYTIDLGSVIQNRPLGLLFQDGLLAGREFDLAAFERDTQEQTGDDIDGAYTAKAGSYRIIMVADGTTLLPNELLCPSVGDHVTPLNVAFSADYTAKARQELKAWGEATARMYHVKKAASFEAETSWPDFLTGETVTPGVGQPYSGAYAGSEGEGYIVTSVQTDMMTDGTTVTFGTFKSKGLLASMIDKVDGVSVSGGTATMGADDTRKTAPMGIDQWRALAEAGGQSGIVRTINEIKDSAEVLGVDVAQVKEQSDKMFNIWFGSGAPAAGGYPAAEWATAEEQALHVQDIYYDVSRQAGTAGGRAWRWVVTSGGGYGWEEVTDLDTRAALEKIADVASDGVLSGGAEKARVYVDYWKAVGEYRKQTEQATGYGLTEAAAYTAFRTAFAGLVKVLDGGREDFDMGEWDLDAQPSWIADLTQDTVMGEYGVTPAAYRKAWDDYYAGLAGLAKAIGDAAQTATATAQDTADTAQKAAEAAQEAASGKMTTWVGVAVPEDYKKGDFWLKLDSEGSSKGTMYVCVRDKGEEPSAGDFMAMSDTAFSSVTQKLAEFVQALKGANSIVTLDFALVLSQGRPSGVANGTVWYGGDKVEVKKSTGWTAVASESVKSEAASLLSMLGYGRTVNFYYSRKPSSANLYDVYYVSSAFTDKLTGKEIDGGLGVWVWGAGGWERVWDNTTSVLKNYSDHIVQAVFGTDAESGGTSYASQILTAKNFSKMMSEAEDLTTGDKALAAIATIVERDTAGALTGKVKISGDTIDFESKETTIQGRILSADKRLVIETPTEDIVETVYEDGDDEGRDVVVGQTRDVALTLYKEPVTYASGAVPMVVLSCNEVKRSGGGTYKAGMVSVKTSGGSTGSYMSSTEVVSPRFGYYSIREKKVYPGAGGVFAAKTFTTADGKTVTVRGGIITDVS